MVRSVSNSEWKLVINARKNGLNGSVQHLDSRSLKAYMDMQKPWKRNKKNEKNNRLNDSQQENQK